MSRIGKKPIEIPQGVEVTLTHAVLTIKGHKGTQNVHIPEKVIIEQKDKVLDIKIKNEKNNIQRALWGTIHRLIENAIIGVSVGFSKKLIISGVGYRAQLKGKMLALELGFSHPIDFPVPDDITIEVEGNNVIIVSGFDKQSVGQVSAEIRNFRKPEPYKGKGIAYENEKIYRKSGKQSASSAR